MGLGDRGGGENGEYIYKGKKIWLREKPRSQGITRPYIYFLGVAQASLSLQLSCAEVFSFFFLFFF